MLTQYKAHSLIQHVQRGWAYLRGELGEFVDLIPAQQQLGEHWYRGTADAVFQNLDYHPRRTIRYSFWCLPVITSTRWITVQ